jgi:hypothetical protein
MNERIKILAVEAKLIASEPNGFDQNNLSKAQEKFAELIVQECVQLCQECIDDGCVEAQEPMEKIKQHFGVEE